MFTVKDAENSLYSPDTVAPSSRVHAVVRRATITRRHSSERRPDRQARLTAYDRDHWRAQTINAPRDRPRYHHRDNGKWYGSVGTGEKNPTLSYWERCWNRLTVLTHRARSHAGRLAISVHGVCVTRLDVLFTFPRLTAS